MRFEPDPRPAPTPLPKPAHPVEGEQFASLVERAAYDHGAAVGDILDAAGLDRSASGGVALYGCHLHPDDLHRVATLLGTTTDSIAATLLSRYEGTVLEHGTLTTPWGGAPHRVARSWVNVRASRACPACVADDDGAWQVHWKLSAAAVCTRHRLLLAATCPGCGNHLRRGDTGKPLPSFPSLVPDPHLCFNSSRTTSTGRQVPCRHHVCDIDVGDPLDGRYDRLVHAQEVWLSVADGKPDWVGGEMVLPDRWMDIAHGVAALVNFGLRPDHLDRNEWLFPDPCVDTWDRIAWQRDRQREKGEAAPSYTTPPATSFHAAIVVDLTVGALCASTLTDGIDWLVGAARDASPDRWRQLPDRLNLAPELRLAWEEASAPLVGFSRMSGWTHVGAPGPADEPYGVGAEHFPHLVGEDHYRLHYADLLPGTAGPTGRAFVALCMARAVEGLRSWPEVFAAFEFEPRRGERIVDVCSRRVTDRIAWWQTVHQSVREVNVMPDPTDFSELRWHLRDLVDIDAGTWKAICKDALVHPGRTPARRRNAAAWLWTRLTCGDPRHSPAFEAARQEPDGPLGTSLVDDFTRFRSWLTPEVEAALLEHGVAVLADAEVVT